MRATRALRLHISHGPYFDTSAKAARLLEAEVRRILPHGKSRGDRLKTHAEVVNLELCSTAADLLAPSLQEFKGCHIIDANPGAGVWSSTINNLLRPKRHVLVEDDARFDPFLDRLLEADPSYIRVRYPGFDPQSLERVVDEGLVPRPEPSQDPNKPTTSLLILVNLTRSTRLYPETRLKEVTAIRRDFIINCRNAWLRSGIYKYGPVRTLAWIDESAKDGIVPRAVTGSDASVPVERYANHVHVVAENYSRSARPDAINRSEWESTWEVIKRMEASGVEIPAKRQNPLHKTLLSQGDDWPRVWEQIMNTKPESLEQLQLPTGKKIYHRGRKNIAPLLEQYDEVSRLERLAVDESQPEEVRFAAREEYEKLYATTQPRAESLPVYLRQIFYRDMERKISRIRNPPSLHWDRRPFEPVDCTTKDFVSNKARYQGPSPSLLDFCPSSPPHQYSKSDLVYWERLVRVLLQRGADTVPTRLHTISPGAAEYIMPKLSALHDPLRYGSFHPEHFRVRLMTIEMLEQLVQVWRSWPSRPRHHEESFLEDKDWLYELQNGPSADELA